MTGLQWFILAFIVMAALGYWNWQKTKDQIQRLQAEGFTVTAGFNGSPKLLLDQHSQTIAVVAGDEYRRYSLSQISSVEYGYDAGSQVDENFRIEIYLQSESRNIEKIKYSDEWRAKEQFKRLQQLLNQSPQ